MSQVPSERPPLFHCDKRRCQLEFDTVVAGKPTPFAEGVKYGFQEAVSQYNPAADLKMKWASSYTTLHKHVSYIMKMYVDAFYGEGEKQGKPRTHSAAYVDGCRIGAELARTRYRGMIQHLNDTYPDQPPPVWDTNDPIRARVEQMLKDRDYKDEVDAKASAAIPVAKK